MGGQVSISHSLPHGRETGGPVSSGPIEDSHIPRLLGELVPLDEPRARPSFDDYFLGIARAVAARADCTRRQVGAVVVDGSRRIVSTGYNGSPPGGPSCLAGQCPRGLSNVEPGSSYDTGAGSCVAVHAEQNAVLYAGVAGARGSTLYITDAPCQGCRRLIAAAGISRVVYPGGEYTLKEHK